MRTLFSQGSVEFTQNVSINEILEKQLFNRFTQPYYTALSNQIRSPFMKKLTKIDRIVQSAIKI